MQVRIYTRQCLIWPIEQISIPDFSGTVKDLLAREVRDFAPDKLSVSIYVDGKKAGHVYDAACGGCYNYDYDTTEYHNIVNEKIKEHYEKYPEIDMFKIYENPIDTIDMNNLPRQAYQDMFEPEDCFFSDLLNLALREKDYKKHVGNGYTVMVCIDFLRTKCPTPLPISFACTPAYDYNKDFAV